MKWTMTHAHFLQMGGFRLNYLEDGSFFSDYKYSYRTMKKEFVVQECILDFDSLRKTLEKKLIDFPETTAKEIEDRSKSDALTKGVALLQISWFLVQLIARAHQHLIITEIELTTAALAGLNSIMYLFWWNKPFDVRCPIVIRTKDLERRLVEVGDNLDQTWSNNDEKETWKQVEMDTAGDNSMNKSRKVAETVDDSRWSFPVAINGKFSSDFNLTFHLMTKARKFIGQALITVHTTLAWFIGCLYRAIFSPKKIALWFYNSTHMAQEPISTSGTSAPPQFLNRIVSWNKHTFTNLLHLLRIFMFLPIRIILHPAGFVELDSFSDTKDKMENQPTLELLLDWVNMTWITGMMFYSEPADTKLLLIFSALTGAVFGSIHCTAWNSNFSITSYHWIKSLETAARAD